ncbi:MFS transporter [Streptomyces sp. NPDC020858]|uniref:MFS transporter n=1 Tax=Streptomyces sp. NPDC020858 TaxID=3365097 RepID=UPI00378BCF29
MTSSPRRRRERRPRTVRTTPLPAPGAPCASSPTSSPWRDRDFRTLFGAAALSQLGTNTGYVAIPLLALTALDASPAQVGTLAALSTLTFLLIGLPAGARVDRLRTRGALITADLARGPRQGTSPGRRSSPPSRSRGGWTRSRWGSCTPWSCWAAAPPSSPTSAPRASCRSPSAGRVWYGRTPRW